MSEITKTLAKIAKELPKGAISQIADKTGFSQPYVSKFFNGEYNLSEKNMPILDAAEAILQEQRDMEESVQVRFNALIGKGKE